MTRIAFSGGGTGGHIYPGLALAEELTRRMGPECTIFWIGADVGLDRSIVEAVGIDFFGIPSGKLRRYFSLKTIPDFFRVLAGFFASRRILRKQKPALLFSKGGFVSVPPCAAAASLKIPVFTHESDFSPGLATKLNARFAKQIFTAYDETAGFFPEKYRDRIIKTGNPVRPAFYAADPNKGKEFLGLPPAPHSPLLLVLGGSQGAAEINDLVRKNLAELTKHYMVVHQTGRGNERDCVASERYKPYPYIGEEMSDVLAAADLALGRSGAGTVWECAAQGKPMVLIPLSGNSRGDQVENARYFEKAGAAICLTGADLTNDNFIRVITELAGDSRKRLAMAEASQKIGKINGAVRACDVIMEFINNE